MLRLTARCAGRKRAAKVAGSWRPQEGKMANRTGLTRSKNLMIGSGLAALLAVIFIAQSALNSTAVAQMGLLAPRFEPDPLWPKPLPNHWVLGQTVGVWVDSDDHVWVVPQL